MKHTRVLMTWSRWIDINDEDAAELAQNGVLYMYATRNEVVHVGKAEMVTAKQRIIEHRSDDVGEHIATEYSPLPRIKVGVPDNQGVPLLPIIESLLIYVERHANNACRGNVRNTGSRKECYPGLVVENVGDWKPLNIYYYDVYLANREQ